MLVCVVITCMHYSIAHVYIIIICKVGNVIMVEDMQWKQWKILCPHDYVDVYVYLMTFNNHFYISYL